MATIVVTEAAARSLMELVDSHSLPDDTADRIRRTLAPLSRFPLLGPAIDPARPELRFLIGPWRWLVIVYAYRERENLVAVLAFEDGRSARSSGRRKRPPHG
jgi:plasmid stabilization system protein ParE